MNKCSYSLVLSTGVLVCAACILFFKNTHEASLEDHAYQPKRKVEFQRTITSRKKLRDSRHQRNGSAIEKTEAGNQLNSLHAQVIRMGIDSPDPTCLRLKLVYAYADNDPDAGMAWLEGLDPANHEVRNMYVAFAMRLGVIGQNKWKEYHEKMRPGSLSDAFLCSAIIGMGHSDVVKAWNNYQSLASAAWNKKATDTQVFNRLAQINAEQFWDIASNLDGQKGDNHNASYSLDAFFSSAVFKDSSNAVPMLATVTNREARKKYTSDFMRGLQRRQLVDFGYALVDSNFDKKEKDELIHKLASRVYDSHISDGAKLAMQIDDQELRASLLQQIKLYAKSQGPDIEETVSAIVQKQ